ncbi:hypothetical protein QR680_015903 [Steinernema hermaphroditum]|uniref:7TM GPCR serpentine receptor class x (Srx) domain-containing protein n=1 Tax=Steinernema hermaphroditum TaxID=289476 RepID=A0AA39LLP2_9BILA|nr:hypothetical protein QR680_015903 [Steinernema hermaphroditum]
MEQLNVTEVFYYGNELQGRGETSAFDIAVGVFVTMLSLAAVSVGIRNLYIIKKMTIFHSAFGCLWISRTIGEIGANIVHVIYSGPITILQPKDISPTFGIVAFTVGYFFACESCVLHQYISANRMFAVCTPIKYKSIFTKRVTATIILITWLEVAIIMTLYHVIPCSMIGYSPQFYEYVFIKCTADMDRDYSIVGTLTNRGCFVMCLFSLVCDFITLSKIIHIKLTNHGSAQDASFKRNVRFFAQTVVQNISMYGTLVAVVMVNNRASSGQAYSIIAFNALIASHLNNGLALIIFNPEVHKFLGIRKNIKIDPTSSERLAATSAKNAAPAS